jgi:hypothetical protein
MPQIFRELASGVLGVDSCEHILNLLGASSKALRAKVAAIIVH